MWASALLSSVSLEGDGTFSVYASAGALAAERAALLDGVRLALRPVLEAGLGAQPAVRCEGTLGRRLVLSLQAAAEHGMAPPLVALRRPCLLYNALVLLARKHAPAARAAVEAFNLAKILVEKHLATEHNGTDGAPPPARVSGEVAELYAARLWLCLALARRSAGAWLAALAEALPGAFSEHALLAIADERELLLALLEPLQHVAFTLPESAAAARGEMDLKEGDAAAPLPSVSERAAAMEATRDDSSATTDGPPVKGGIDAEGDTPCARAPSAARHSLATALQVGMPPPTTCSSNALSHTVLRQPATPLPSGTPAEATVAWQVGDHSPPGIGVKGEPDLFAHFLQLVARSPFQLAAGRGREKRAVGRGPVREDGESIVASCGAGMLGSADGRSRGPGGSEMEDVMEAHFGAGPFASGGDEEEPAYVPFDPASMTTLRVRGALEDGAVIEMNASGAAGLCTEERSSARDDCGCDNTASGYAPTAGNLRLDGAPTRDAGANPSLVGTETGRGAWVLDSATALLDGRDEGIPGIIASAVHRAVEFAVAKATHAHPAGAASLAPPRLPGAATAAATFAPPTSRHAAVTPIRHTPRNHGRLTSRRRPPTQAIIESPLVPPAPLPIPLTTIAAGIAHSAQSGTTSGADLDPSKAGAGNASAPTCTCTAEMPPFGGHSEASAAARQSQDISQSADLWPTISAAPLNGQADRNKASELAGWLEALTRPKSGAAGRLQSSRSDVVARGAGGFCDASGQADAAGGKMVRGIDADNQQPEPDGTSQRSSERDAPLVDQASLSERSTSSSPAIPADTEDRLAASACQRDGREHQPTPVSTSVCARPSTCTHGVLTAPDLDVPRCRVIRPQENFDRGGAPISSTTKAMKAPDNCSTAMLASSQSLLRALAVRGQDGRVKPAQSGRAASLFASGAADGSHEATSKAPSSWESARLSDSQARAAATVYISALRTTRSLRPQVQGSTTQGSNSYPTAALRDGNSAAANWECAFLSTACRALRLRRDAAAEALEQLFSAGGTSGYNDTEIYDGGGSAPERLRLASLSQLPTPDVRWAAAWLPTRAMILQGSFDAYSAVALRTASGMLGVSWRRVCAAADELVQSFDCSGGDAEGAGVTGAIGAYSAAMGESLGGGGRTDRGFVILRYRLLCELVATDILPLGFADGSSAKSSESALVLRRAAPRSGASLVIGVSGLLAPMEGDVAATTDDASLASLMGGCWEATAAYFQVCEWWSLAWGGPQLRNLATALTAHQQSLGVRDKESLTAGSLGGGVRTGWRPGVGGALALRAAWLPCMDAARAAGSKLAAFLRTRRGGARPVSLMAVGLGARVVWHALEILATLPQSEASGIVQDVLFIAAPITSNPARWTQVRYVVGGRILNVYAPDNPALAFLYRTDHPLSKKCSGLGAVHSHDVENFDASTHVPQGADAYHFAIPAVIEEVALLPCD